MTTKHHEVEPLVGDGLECRCGFRTEAIDEGVALAEWDAHTRFASRRRGSRLTETDAQYGHRLAREDLRRREAGA